MADRTIHVSRIEPHPGNIRADLGDLTELAASIRVHGILQPLVVCAHDWRPGCYLLLAGHRRLAAAKLARVDHVPVTVRAAPDEAAIVMLVENCHRADLGPVEKAEAMGALQAKGWTATAIARQTGLTTSTVCYYLSLLELDEASRERVRSGHVEVKAAVAAVRTARAGRRQAAGKPPRRASVAAEHFSGAHPLAELARVRCELAGHGGRKYGALHGKRDALACGACWEQVIREDERSGGQLAEQARQPEARSGPKRERLAELAGMRLHDSSDPNPPPGVITTAQAADRLGVTRRTVERYKQHLAGAVAGA